MTQEDLIGASTDTLAVIFTGLQRDQIFQLICLGLTVLSIILGVILKVVSLVKSVKAGKALTQDEKDAKIAELSADLEKTTDALEKMNEIFDSASKVLPEKKGV